VSGSYITASPLRTPQMSRLTGLLQSVTLFLAAHIQHKALTLILVDFKCDVTRAKTRFRLSAKRTRPFKSARCAGRQFSRLLAAEVCAISGSNAGYTVFRGSVKGNGFPLHSPVSAFTSPSSASPCAITFQLESNAGYNMFRGSVKGNGYPLHSPVSAFTSPPVRHRVSSHFNRTLPIISVLQTHVQLSAQLLLVTVHANCKLKPTVKAFGCPVQTYDSARIFRMTGKKTLISPTHGACISDGCHNPSDGAV